MPVAESSRSLKGSTVLMAAPAVLLDVTVLTAAPALLPLLALPQDDVALIWLADPSQTAAAVAALQANSAALNIKELIYGQDLVSNTVL